MVWVPVFFLNSSNEEKLTGQINRIDNLVSLSLDRQKNDQVSFLTARCITSYYSF